MAIVEIKVPDIGDFAEVTVIELMVKVGDKVKEGTVVLMLEESGAVSANSSVSNPAPAPADNAQAAPNSVALAAAEPVHAGTSYAGTVDLECDVLVLGGGPGGYSAAFRAADLGLKVVVVERYATLGGVCLNVGCIPSKALLHVAAVMDEVAHLGDLGVDFGKPVVNVDKLRGHKEKVIAKLTGGLAAMAKMRKVTIVRGYGAFVGANHVEVEETSGTAQEKTGSKKVIGFKKAIIAAGSQAVRLPFMPNDPRVVDSTGALALKEVPKRMLILGGGMVGTHAGDRLAKWRWPLRWVPMPLTLARPFTRILRWGNPLGWRRRWRMAVARMCRRRGAEATQGCGKVMADWLLEAWSFQAGRPSCTTVMPDGCQDLLCITDVDGRSQWKWAPLADGAYQVQCEASELFQGWRLRPGCQVDIDGLLQALSGRDATYDPVGVLGDFVRLSEGTTQALRALADCSSVQLACRQLGVAERSLFRHLLKESGRSPVYWRQLARARRAAQGLCSGMPLADLATEHGYADQAHFSREMRRWFDASPQALRLNSAALHAIELAGY